MPSSGYRGVYAHGRRFVAKMMVDGERVYIGVFSTAREAARAYDALARIYNRQTNFSTPRSQ